MGMNMNMNMKMEMEVEEVREYYKSGITKEASWRRSQLKGMQTLLREQRDEICKALYQDLGKHHVEAFRDEISIGIKSLSYALDNMKEWMSGKSARLPLIALFTTAEVVPEPLGVVLVISPWNVPIGLSLDPLLGAITAGNTVVIKPSEMAPASSSLLAKIIPAYLDKRAFKIFEGGPEVGQKLLRLKWDKIFFTGSPRVGRIVMSEAAKNLTPVVLELGGKCPAIVDSISASWVKNMAVNRIIGAKYGSCAGQACIAIDYILVKKSFAPSLIKNMKENIKKVFGENPRKLNSMSRIINKHHFLRLKSFLDDQRVKDSIIFGGTFDEDNLFIEPTLLLDPPLDSELMNEEIFGPLLPIITLEKIEDSVDHIKLRPKPLAIYAFTDDKTLRKRLISETSSGSLVFNDALIQYAADTLPFGGIGESGVGNYHGKFSFDTFSHYKAVARRSYLSEIWFRAPPWNDSKLQLIEALCRYDYFGMLLIVLGFKRECLGPRSFAHVSLFLLSLLGFVSAYYYFRL